MSNPKDKNNILSYKMCSCKKYQWSCSSLVSYNLPCYDIAIFQTCTVCLKLAHIYTSNQIRENADLDPYSYP